jgi:tripartite-type tricarboxylate transporter receptor subunit TctC
MRRMIVGLSAVVFMAASAAAQSATASWPDRPIHLLVPFAAGGSSDIVARLLAQKLSARVGQPVVIENRAGASGVIATEAVLHAAADGYTLGLATTSTYAISPSLMAAPSYDPVKDFAPISMIGAAPFVLAGNPSLPAQNVQELIALAKTKPGKLSYAEAGPTSLAGLCGVLFARSAKVQLAAVSYRGSEEEIPDVVSGRVDLAYLSTPPALPLIRDRKLRALAVTGSRRSPALPDVPTIAESGLPGFEGVNWQAIYAPAGTPSPIVARLNAEVNAILHESDMVEALAKLGVEAKPSTPQELADRITVDLKKWREVIVSAGIKAQ